MEVAFRSTMSDFLDQALDMIDGSTTTLRTLAGEGRVLVVNVASACGLTRQYADLQRLHADHDGITVVGMPCNQFGAQEPGTHEEICTFTEERYGVTFPLSAKLEVNGPGRHPIYTALCAVADADGHHGDVRWNFEKFLVSNDGSIVRFKPQTSPADVL
jgi:glutathione peroxidase